MLSVETDALEAWYARLVGARGTRWYQRDRGSKAAPSISQHKDIEEFRVVDPGGYIIEFYRWKPAYRPAPTQPAK